MPDMTVQTLNLHHFQNDGALALVDSMGEHSRHELFEAIGKVSFVLRDHHNARVAIICEPGIEWLVAAFACWHTGNIAVPLLPSHPVTELSHPILDAEVSLVMHSQSATNLAHELSQLSHSVTVNISEVLQSETISDDVVEVSPDTDALIIYTSGTTGKPKGAVHTHKSIAAMVNGMVDAWNWTSADRTICVLPLNHVHGIVNVSLCALFVGGILEAPQSFDAHHVWNRFESREVSVFMAVPTVYSRLTSAWESASIDQQKVWSTSAARLRLMVSGSAALPVSTLEKWRSISSHTLLERYGMTETGMILSNLLDRRVAGHVGWPMPGTDVRIVDETFTDVSLGTAGELLVRGPQLFNRYWNREDATSESFVEGWFRTGDVGVVEDGGYRLLGRASVDILKTGGEKVSALEIEETFRLHDAIVDCAVVGLPDDEWGQRVVMAYVPADSSHSPSDDEFRRWGKGQLAAAKVPTRFLAVEALPRNTLGKVTKKDVIELFL